MDVSESRPEGGSLVAGTASRGVIRILPQDVSSKIAAGEVVERPASVVKELVENALDAGASEISIEIVGGGAEHILVADNGSGIAGDEVELAFQRFATSKVADSSDLEAISTLGFRGEALPSIAAVASVSLTTRAAEEEVGTRVEVVEGLVIGRGSGCGLQIFDEQASRTHAAVRRDEGGWVLADLESVNGTLLDGRAVTTPAPLAEGSRIEIGDTQAWDREWLALAEATEAEARAALAAGHTDTAMRRFFHANQYYRQSDVFLTGTDPRKAERFAKAQENFRHGAKLHTPPIETVTVACGDEVYDAYFCHPVNPATGKWPAVLLLGGADVNAEINFGSTALMRAAFRHESLASTQLDVGGYREIIRLLRQAGARQ